MGPEGIVHSSGRSVAFTRDTAGRIIRITDPNGHHLQYSYAGQDLDAFTDQAGNRTTFVYDSRHLLLEIHDAHGTQTALAEYDANGRLVAMTDARGARTSLIHDLDGNEEVISDALGFPARAIYDDRGNVLSYEKSVTIEGSLVLSRSLYTYDAQGNETSIVDADGRRQERTWDAFGNPLSQVVDPAGLAITRRATFSAGGHPLTETDPNGDTVTFTLDPRGNATRWVDVDGSASSIGYNTAGQITSVEDAGGRVTMVVYDDAGRVTSRTDALGNATTYTYDANGNRLTETATRTVDGARHSLTTRFEYDEMNRLTRVVDALGQSTRMAYDAVGRLASRTDALGRTTAFVYDGYGSLVEAIHPDGSTDRRRYDPRGDLVETTDREGLVTRYEYDELRRLVATVLPNGGTLRRVYSPAGQLTATIAANGSRTDYEYDGAGRRVLMRQPAVADGPSGTMRRPEWRYEYDAAGRPTATIDPLGNRREMSYDTVTRRVTVRLPDGTTEVEELDQWRRPLRRTDAEGRSTIFEYLANTGRLAAVSLPPPADGQPTPTWRFTYDEIGNTLSQTDPLGRVTRFAYDRLNRPTSMTLPGGQTRAYNYDAAGRVSHLVEFDGTETRFDYDAADRPLRRRLADGTEVTFTYTPGGRRSSVRDARGTTRYSYDAAGRLSAVEQPHTGVVQYTHDTSNRVSSITTPGGTTGYAYDALDRLVGVGTAAGTSRYAYDLAGNLASLALANGVTGALTYNARNQLTTLSYEHGGALMESFTYAYTPAGRRSVVTETGATTSFTYDRMGRLVQETRAGASPFVRQYEYDLAGNRTRMVANGVSTAFTYDANDRLLSAGSIGYTYDPKGNPVTRNQAGALTSFSWTMDNRLASLNNVTGVTSSEYDADGMRTATASPAGTIRYLVDQHNPTGLRQVLEERSGTGDLLQRFNYGIGLLSSEQDGAAHFLQPDGASSVRVLSDGSGAVTDTYDYDAFGNLIAATGDTNDTYLYTGQQLDPESGLYYLRERYYDPAIGRFLGLDPVAPDLRNPLSIHRYAYAGNDPVNFADPTGEEFTLLGLSLSSAISTSLRAIEFSGRGLQLCRIKAFKKAAHLVMSVRSAAVTSELLTAGVGTLTSALAFSSQGVAVSESLRLFKYEHPLAIAGGAVPSHFTGEVEAVEITAKFPQTGQMDLELKGKEFNRAAVTQILGFDLHPFRPRQFGGEAEFSFTACKISVCGLDFGKLDMFVKPAASAAFVGPKAGTFGALSVSVEAGFRIDVVFVPELTFSVKLPDDWSR
jgi:RHS repeat-associated protein